MKTLLIISLILFINSGCAFRSLGDTIEGIYTDEIVVKPSKSNYKTAPNSSSKPILRDKDDEIKSPQDLAKLQSEIYNTKGYIKSVSFDPDNQLYLYNFQTVPDEKELVFFYDKKLPYKNDELIELSIKDNFLQTVKYKSKIPRYEEPSLSKKIKMHKKRKRNFKIHEAIEEKINTL